MHNNKYGFTLVEIIIVVAVIGILSTIGAVTYMGVQEKSRDSQRETRATIIANSLEKYFENNGEYPKCPDFANNPGLFLTDIKVEVFQTPQSTTNSIECSSNQPDISVLKDVYTYQYNNTDGNFILWYISEVDKSIYHIYSKHSLLD